MSFAELNLVVSIKLFELLFDQEIHLVTAMHSNMYTNVISR